MVVYHYYSSDRLPSSVSIRPPCLGHIYQFLNCDNCNNVNSVCGANNPISVSNQPIGNGTTNYPLASANKLYLAGSYEQAAESYAKAVTFDPSLLEGWLNLGNSLYFLGKYQASLNAYNALLKLEPQNADALAGKSLAILALNRTSGSNISTITPTTLQGPKIANLGSPKYNGGKIGGPVVVGDHSS